MSEFQESEQYLDRYEPTQPAPLRVPAIPMTLNSAVAEPGTASLSAYWQILLRRRWSILTVMGILTTLVTIASFKMAPVYRATARVEVDADAPQSDSLNALYQQLPTDQDFLRTQIQVLKTDQLAWQTIESLGLGDNAGFVKDHSQHAGPDQRKNNLIRRFKKNLSAELVPGSRVIQVSYESTDPAMASSVANGLVNNYVEYNFRQKYDATRQASERMEEQLDELKNKVEKSQRALVDYQREHAIANVNDKENVVEQRLSQLSTDLTACQTDRIQKEALDHLLQTKPEAMTTLAQGELIQRLQEKLAELRSQYVEALAQYGPAFPKVVRLQKQVSDQELQIQSERSRIAGRIHDDYIASLNREAMLKEAVGTQKEELAKLNNLLIEQNILTGEFETNQKLYQDLLQRLKEATVTAGLRSTNIHLVDPALVPSEPVRPKKLLNVSVTLLISFILGTMLAFVQEGMDNSIKSAEEIESLLAIPTLAIIPAMRIGGTNKMLPWGADPVAGKRVPGPLMVPALAVLRQPRSPIAEAYRALRTSILLSIAKRGPYVLLVTSSNSSEGKTSTAINLATALGQSGASVLLVDCDLRKPGVGHTLGLDSRKGISSIFAGRHTLEESLQKYEALPNLWILPAGPVASSPAEMLASPLAEKLLSDLRERFTYIVIDSPPLLAVTDATILSTFVDGALLVVEGGVTPRRAVARARKMLMATGVRIMGVALNKIDSRHGAYYGYYGHSYSYGNFDPIDPEMPGYAFEASHANGNGTGNGNVRPQ